MAPVRLPSLMIEKKIEASTKTLFSAAACWRLPPVEPQCIPLLRPHACSDSPFLLKVNQNHILDGAGGGLVVFFFNGRSLCCILIYYR